MKIELEKQGGIYFLTVRDYEDGYQYKKFITPEKSEVMQLITIAVEDYGHRESDQPV